MTDTTHTAFATPSPLAPRAVEVVGMLGDSVVEVAHLSPAGQDRQRSRRTARLLISAGAALLIASALAFAVGVRTAADDATARRAWIAAQDRPAWEFRPTQLHAGYDWVAFGGLFGGLLAIAWGVARLRTPAPRTRFVIGGDHAADMAIADAPAGAFPLVDMRGDAAVVTFTDTMAGALYRAGDVKSLSDLAALGVASPSFAHPEGRELIVPVDGTVRLSIGATAFAIRHIPATTGRIGAAVLAIESRVAKFLAMSALAHILVLALFASLPPEARSLAMEIESVESPYTRISSVATEPPAPEQSAGGDGQTSGDSGPAAAPGESGEAGDPATTASGKLTIRDRSMPAPALTRAEQITLARRAGFLGDLQAMDEFLTPLGLDDASSGEGLLDVYGKVTGEEYGPGGGRFGMGVTGFGPGGGSIKSGDYRTIGCCGNGDKFGVPGGKGPGLGPKGEFKGPVVTIDRPRVIGTIDKEIIRQYIRRHLKRIEHCYERQLLSSPGLEGTVNTDFVISGQGAVLSATASGTGNAGLESCVAGVVKSIQFPRPEGDGVVQVKYPFNFRRAGN